MELMYQILQENIKKLELLSLCPAEASQIDTQSLIDSISEVKARDIVSEIKIANHNCLNISQASVNGQLERVLYENMILKKAVVKLLDKLNQCQNVEKENFDLKENLQEMHITNYTLRMHLLNAFEGKNVIENFKDIY